MSLFQWGNAGRKLFDRCRPAAARQQPLPKRNGHGGGSFQIYSIKRKKIYEHFELENPTLANRSNTFKRWARPVLDRLEGKTFCVHLGDGPDNETAEGMPNLCYCKRKDDDRDLTLIPDAYYQWFKGYVNKRKYRILYKIHWEEKIEKVIFRGSCTGAMTLEDNLRAQLCSLDHSLIDAENHLGG